MNSCTLNRIDCRYELHSIFYDPLILNLIQQAKVKAIARRFGECCVALNGPTYLGRYRTLIFYCQQSFLREREREREATLTIRPTLVSPMTIPLMTHPFFKGPFKWHDPTLKVCSTLTYEWELIGGITIKWFYRNYLLEELV